MKVARQHFSCFFLIQCHLPLRGQPHRTKHKLIMATRTQVGQIDWRVPDANPPWVMGSDSNPSPAEPLGAADKRIRQKFVGDEMVSLGIVKNIDGKLVRFYSDPQRADAMYQKGPNATHYEPQQVVTLENRDKEVWTFVVTPDAPAAPPA